MNKYFSEKGPTEEGQNIGAKHAADSLSCIRTCWYQYNKRPSVISKYSNIHLEVLLSTLYFMHIS
jgi:hypothetical protein